MAITPLPDIPGVYLLRIKGSWEGRPMGTQLVFHALLAPSTGSADVAVAASLASNAAIDFAPFANDVLSVQFAGVETSCYALHTPTSPAQLGSGTANGNQSGDVSPGPVAIAIKHLVRRRGRGSQGRNFLSAFPASAITGTGLAISTSFANSVTAAFNTLITSLTTHVETDTGVALLHAQLSKKGDGAVYPIDSSTCETLLSTQRRRTGR